MPTFKKIATFPLPHQAHFAKAFLETHDIPAFVKDDNISGAYGGLSLGFGGAKVLVPAELAEEATELLKTAPEFQTEEIPWQDAQGSADDEREDAAPDPGKEEPTKLSRTFRWLVMPFITAAVLVILWAVVYYAGGGILRIVTDLFTGDVK